MDRIKEPSTWAGVAALAQVVAQFLPPQWRWVADIVSAGAGGAAVKLRERPVAP